MLSRSFLGQIIICALSKVSSTIVEREQQSACSSLLRSDPHRAAPPEGGRKKTEEHTTNIHHNFIYYYLLGVSLAQHIIIYLCINDYNNMKFSSILALAIGCGSSSTSAFVATARRPATTAARRVNAPAATRRLEMMGRDSNFDLSGNNWKPDSEKMGVSSFVFVFVGGGLFLVGGFRRRRRRRRRHSGRVDLP